MIIWKYDVPKKMSFYFTLPVGAKFLKIEIQREKYVMWILVDPDVEEMKDLKFKFICTGENFDNSNLKYLDSIFPDNYTVFHLFQVEE